MDKKETDKLRQAKNVAVCVVTLASGAAMEGGLLPEEARPIADGYILAIERMTEVSKVNAAMRRAEQEFKERVDAIRARNGRNELIDKTKYYILQNLHKEIRVPEIGRQIGASASWLSELFHRVEGITIPQYIRKERIRVAEKLLRYSEYDMKSIAASLAFCSQSHFGMAFKEQTGMTPTQYRKKYGASSSGKKKR